MLMIDLYLIWIPRGGSGGGDWVVAGAETCPDPAPFPSYIYRQYEIPHEKMMMAFRRLQSARNRIEDEGILPAKGRENEIFPELSDLLAD